MAELLDVPFATCVWLWFKSFQKSKVNVEAFCVVAEKDQQLIIAAPKWSNRRYFSSLPTKTTTAVLIKTVVEDIEIPMVNPNQLKNAYYGL